MLKGINYYYSRFGISGVISAIKSKLTDSHDLLKVELEDIKAPFYLRLRTSDFPTFEQVFIQKAYSFDINRPPQIIIDAGANIGLASIYFANKFPKATIIALEPEKKNFELLKSNTSTYPNITPVHAALWHKNEEIDLIDPGLGNWGFMTEMKAAPHKLKGSTCHSVKALTVDKIMQIFELERIDILKIDIEGAEKEVFSDSAAWIECVDSIIVELHERMKPGCNRSFYNGSNGFKDEWVQGENIYLSKGNCLAMHSG
ncbi:FkbM family methyltransferase [Pseudomaricurvus alkylphenolicus]|uniref:FkbM family methyltransferase n=1 Tax=Pseudomaricurvus alkylphenolicus TaxID=1306991 RepID=UPI001424448A|nr:FkbM family methyltransferase [Pseudomaricurvus alkylphenolicus]NIB43115.1 FkbM family methyltransferase [Pseudomaricurvus alkylphenolicus]